MEFALSPPRVPGRPRDRRKSSTPRKRDEPGWAKGLRQLYNSVVDEPLPDSFNELLKKLEDGKDG